MKKQFVEIDGKKVALEVFLATKNLKVEGYLDLGGCTGLTHVKSHPRVKKSIKR